MIRRPLRRAGIEVRPSSLHGYGVFATRRLARDEIIEECHCVVLAGTPVDANLEDYVYEWPQVPNGRAVVLGSGSIFNGSSEPNAAWEVDVARGLYIYRALREIAPDEEILIDYGWTPGGG